MMDISAEARSWIGTPFHHKMASKHLGVDCLGLVVSVWKNVMRKPFPIPLPRYRNCSHPFAHIGLDPEAELGRVFQETEQINAQLVLIKISRAHWHLGLLVGDGENPTIIHAHAKRGVIAQKFGSYWRQKTIKFYKFP